MSGYRSKVVERIELPDRDEREAALEAAGYNLFGLDAADVYVDLLTDSGTGAMSDEQWAALVRGDEAYAGSESFAEFRAAVEEVTGFGQVVPVHQGRGGENVLYGALVEAGDYVPNNTHFDTTRAHVANSGGEPVDCPAPGATDPDSDAPFKGNLDVDAVRSLADEVSAENVPAVILTVTNNPMAGQPVSVENARRARAVADELDATFVIDACRFAENAEFVRRREDGYGDAAVAEIAREQLGLADAVLASGKKDGLVNVGGFVAVAEGVEVEGASLFERCRQRAIMYEGFPTYGGMAGRDLSAMAVGLREAVEDAYVRDRTRQVHRLADLLEGAGVPVYRPVGGHAVYLLADRLLPDVPPERFPGQALACELYREGGVRGVELGSFAFPARGSARDRGGGRDGGGDCDGGGSHDGRGGRGGGGSRDGRGGRDGGGGRKGEDDRDAGDDPDGGGSGTGVGPAHARPGRRPEFVRLALPRRVYHDEHLDHVAETARRVVERTGSIPGYEVVDEPPVPELRHFSAELRPTE